MVPLFHQQWLVHACTQILVLWLQNNMDLAYINRVNGCPCGDSEMREKLLIFLKGSNARKDTLRRQEPALYAKFQLIWNIRDNHIVSGLPSCLFPPLLLQRLSSSIVSGPRHFDVVPWWTTAATTSECPWVTKKKSISSVL